MYYHPNKNVFPISIRQEFGIYPYIRNRRKIVRIPICSIFFRFFWGVIQINTTCIVHLDTFQIGRTKRIGRKTFVWSRSVSLSRYDPIIRRWHSVFHYSTIHKSARKISKRDFAPIGCQLPRCDCQIETIVCNSVFSCIIERIATSENIFITIVGCNFKIREYTILKVKMFS